MPSFICFVVSTFALLLLLTFYVSDLFATLAFLPSAQNAFVGEPSVHCGGNHIEVSFDTRNSFNGIVFVEGKLNEPQCRSVAATDAPMADESAPIGRGAATAARNAQIRLSFGTCGIKYTKHDYPKGIYLSIRLVVSFHAYLLSKLDRVFDLRCFYMEMEHELEKQFRVRMGPPDTHTKQIPMPICRYEVLSEGPHGRAVYYAKVGQMVYHKWTCEAKGANQFCMIVHSCIVDDGNGDKVQLIDEQGCARDKYLLQNLEYVSDLMVGKEAHVYKYADRQSIYFDCKISLRVKDPSCEFCAVPHCPDPPRRKHFYNFVDRKRKLTKRYLGDVTNNKSQQNAKNNSQNDAISGSGHESRESICALLTKYSADDDKRMSCCCFSSATVFWLVLRNALILFGAIFLTMDSLKKLKKIVTEINVIEQ